jgi:ATP/maltotriose-dependent transcriptional regulator MalT
MKPSWRVLLLLAPAGYGKPVFLSKLADIFPGDVAWYNLDPHDNKPHTFVKHLTYALNQFSSSNEMDLRRLLTQPIISEQSRTTAVLLSNILESFPNGAPIILDNFQTITDPVIYQIITNLIPLLPA